MAGLSRALGLYRRELVLVIVEAESLRWMWDVAIGFVKLDTGHQLDSLKSSRRFYRDISHSNHSTSSLPLMGFSGCILILEV